MLVILAYMMKECVTQNPASVQYDSLALEVLSATGLGFIPGIPLAWIKDPSRLFT